MGEIIKDETTYNPPPAESQWLTFDEGITTIRLLSHSYTFRSHYVKSESKSYDCTGFVETCKWCQKGNRSRSRWAYMVLVREDEPSVLAMEVGWSIFETILNLAKDKDFGNPRSYDLKITRSGTGTDTSYTVIPGKDTPLSEKEEKVVGELSDVDKATDKLKTFYKKDETDDVEPVEEEDDFPFPDEEDKS